MFSDEGRNLDQETLEYAWMIEIQLGRLTGKLTTPQVCTSKTVEQLTPTILFL
jgi:hypothetical protein